MTQAISQTERINEVQRTLDGIGFQRKLYRVLAGLVRAAWLTLSAMLVMIIIDAAFALPGNARVVMAAVLAVVFIASLIAAFFTGGLDTQQQAADARRVERANHLHNNAIINALFLSKEAEQHGEGLTGVLARRSVKRGQDALHEADQQKIIDRQCLRREAGWLWAALVAWLIVGMIQPRVFSSVLPRIVNPLGSNAPFSMTEIDVTVNPEEVFTGDDANVTATINGRVPDQVDIVILDEQGNEIDRVPMREIDPSQLAQNGKPQANGEGGSPESSGDTPDAAYERSLRNLTEPLHFRIEADGARSGDMTIEPRPRPEGDGEGQAGEPNGQGQQDGQHQDGQPNGQGNQQGDSADGAQSGQGSQQGGQGGSLDDGSLRDRFPDFFDQLDQLARNAGGLQQRAQEMKRDMPANMDSPEAEQWKRDMQQLQRDMQAFRQNAGQLAQMARDLARQMSGEPQMQSLLTRMAMQLDMLAMNGLGQMPQGRQQPGQQDQQGQQAPGQPGQGQSGQGQGSQPGILPGQGEGQGEGQGQQPGLGLGQGQGQGEGQGQGGSQPSNAAAGAWLDGVNRAGLHDAAQLDRMMRELAEALTDRPGDQDADATQKPSPERSAIGKYLERIEQENTDAEAPDAVILRTPPEYRDLTGRYFKRVEDDQPE